MSTSTRLARSVPYSWALGHICLAMAAATALASEPPVAEIFDAGPQQLEAEGFTPLFDGKNLAGWENPYDHGKARVEDGDILLEADKKFFLVTKETFQDFCLIAEVKLPEGEANSGIMFRCHVEPNNVFGYQAECDGSPRRWSGGLYDEGRRSWIWPSQEGRSEAEFLERAEESQNYFKQEEVAGALDRDGWNRYVIVCRGDLIEIYLNGVQTTSLRDSVDAAGHIGIQHHGEKGQTYRFRNLFIKPISEAPGSS